MLWRIDPSLPAPLFEQLAATVRGAVISGALRPGDRLPPARELATSLDVNMHTVLRAYQVVRDEGIIELRRGRGAVVIGEPDSSRLRGLVREVIAEAGRHGLGLDDIVGLLRKQAIS
ncbi:MAG: GntR family transcriptional regulator [Propioniciclava sp.]|uniref:GntR family transcriptional regulator n=1 Tax=Propioniciclava sp. TaxID=2038686 RepID=UPI0039E2696A